MPLHSAPMSDMADTQTPFAEVAALLDFDAVASDSTSTLHADVDALVGRLAEARVVVSAVREQAKETRGPRLDAVAAQRAALQGVFAHIEGLDEYVAGVERAVAASEKQLAGAEAAFNTAAARRALSFRAKDTGIVVFIEAPFFFGDWC